MPFRWESGAIPTIIMHDNIESANGQECTCRRTSLLVRVLKSQDIVQGVYPRGNNHTCNSGSDNVLYKIILNYLAIATESRFYAIDA